MASMKDDVLQVIADSIDIRNAAEKIYRGSKDRAIYVITVGLEHIHAKANAAVRRTLRHRVISKTLVKGKTYGSVRRSKSSLRKAAEATRELFTKYMIGSLPLGEATKEFLLQQAQNERASSKGHLRVAYWYEALAEPMATGQIVADYWKSEKACELIREEIWLDTEEKDVHFE
jgi:hypothetical protein